MTEPSTLSSNRKGVDGESAVRVLVVHNHYREPGGEDRAFSFDVDCLRSGGHAVEIFEVSNHDIAPGRRGGVAVKSVWNGDVYAGLRDLCRRFRPDVVHFHNTFPLVSPAGYYAAAAGGAAVVQTLHNYRLACTNAQLLRGGGPCEDCVGTIPWRAVVHACYRNDRAASVVVAAMLTIHRIMGTWRNRVHRYIALSEFARAVMVRAGLPKERIAVRPNAVTDRSSGSVADDERHGALFVGRLSAEKGIEQLLAAWRTVPEPLCVVGDGPLSSEVARSVGKHVEWAGTRGSEWIADAMRRSAVLVVPSLWFEAFPLVVCEAFSMGLPVIASRLGSLAEIVEDGVTGLHVLPGCSDDLAEKVRWALGHPSAMRRMGRNARKVYLERYTPAESYRRLMTIYREAIVESRFAGAPHPVVDSGDDLSHATGRHSC